MDRVRILALAIVILGLCPLPSAQAADPLASVMWPTVRDVLFGDAAIMFDERVRVFTPPTVEDNMTVPVSVRVEDLAEVREIVLFVDHNPVPKALAFFPTAAAPYFATRIKVQEASPIRAAARTADGIWHVGGVRVDAAGGGCTTPSVAQSTLDWSRLGEVTGLVRRRLDGRERLRLRVVHPMDTGLVAGIPAFFLEWLAVRTPEGRELARFELFEPVAENPVLSLEPNTNGVDFLISGMDNNGNEIAARITGIGSAP